MPTYMLELYLEAADAAQMPAALARVRASAALLTGRGAPVRCLLMILVPGDETCFWLYDARSADIALQASRHAGIGTGRVVEARLIVEDPDAHLDRASQ
jgi:hypothetical protein